MLRGQHQHVVSVAGVEVEVAGSLPAAPELLERAVRAQVVDDGATALLAMRLQQKLRPSKGSARQQSPIAVGQRCTGTTLQQQPGVRGGRK